MASGERPPSGQPANPGTGGLPSRWFGRANIEVTTLALGGAGVGGLYGEVSDEEGVAALHRAMDLGIRYIDTSPFYGEGQRRVGLALAARGGLPEGLHISTKTGTHPARHGDYSAAATRWSVENSLELLGLPRVDILYVHATESMAPILAPGGAVEELLRLKAEGRIGAIGLGVRDHGFHRQAIASGDFDVLLTYADYTLVRQSAAELIDEAVAAGLGVVLGQVLLVGLLAGADPLADPRLAAMPDARAAHDWWLWARDRAVPLQAVAIQFAMRHPKVSTVMIGARTAQEVEENVAYAMLPIADEIWREVDERIAKQNA